MSNQNSDIVELLLAYGAVTKRTDIYGVTPLEKAMRLNNKEIIALLKEE